MEDLIRAHVERLFREAPDRFQELCQNPVLGGLFHRLDPVEEQNGSHITPCVLRHGSLHSCRTVSRCLSTRMKSTI
jgi:hypothetical protein